LQYFNRFGLTWSCALLLGLSAAAQSNPPRARDLGVPFDGTPGPLDAITDVAGVEVGHVTLIEGNGALHVGEGPVRTGVTAVLPRGKDPMAKPVFVAWQSQNGNGEMTGTAWIEESGFLEGPVLITNTHSVGVVRDAVIQWRVSHGKPDAEGYWWSLPVVAETWDGWLNDVNGFHVKTQHALQALDSAHGGPVEEGSVGGGTGMICNGYKGGIGTASRRVTVLAQTYTVAALVQCNYGTRQNLRIAGINVGREIAAPEPYAFIPSEVAELGSIIVVIATDAPLISTQLKRLTRRITLGLGRNGSISGNGSGDLFVAFSTANEGAADDAHLTEVKMLPNGKLDEIFRATVEVTEESIVNAMVAARDMSGADNHRVIALPHDALRQVLKKYNRLTQ
jgi:L-aminopeptidase/D-esterase-like protein